MAQSGTRREMLLALAGFALVSWAALTALANVAPLPAAMPGLVAQAQAPAASSGDQGGG